MNSITYETQGINAYLVYKLAEDEIPDSFAKGMLQENEIDGIISPSYTQRDEDRFFKYQVTSMISLNDFLAQPLEKKSLLLIIRSFIKAVVKLDEYMLTEDGLLLNTEFIFLNLNTKEVALIYLPVESYNNGTNAKEFLISLVSHCRYDTAGDTEYVALLINALNDPDLKTLAMLIPELERIEKKTGKGTDPNRENSREKEVKHAGRKSEYGARPVQENLSPALDIPASAVVSVPKETAKNINTPVIEPRIGEVKRSEEKKKSYFGLFGSKEKKEESAKNVPQVPAAKIPGMRVPGVEAPIQQQVPKKEKKLFAFDKKKEAPKREKAEKENKKSALPIPGLPFRKETEERKPLPAEPVSRPMESYAPAVQSYSGESDGRENTVMFSGGEEGGTVIIGEGTAGFDEAGIRQAAGKIVCSRTGRSMIVNKEVFRIGRDPGYVDFLISDNKAISASHADIHMRGGAFFLVDKNSSNHTFLNGKQLVPQKEYELGNKDSIIIANEELVFSLT